MAAAPAFAARVADSLRKPSAFKFATFGSGMVWAESEHWSGINYPFTEQKNAHQGSVLYCPR